MSIIRVRCGNSACGVTHACLYDFLIPYKLHTVEAISPYIRHYLKVLSSYLDTAWRWELELMPDPALVFRWLSTLLRHISLLVQQVQLAAVDSSIDLVRQAPEQVKCLNDFKAHSVDKTNRLNLGAVLLALVYRLGVNDPVVFVHHFFLHTSEISIVCLSGRRNIRICRGISRSHSLQCLIF